MFDKLKQLKELQATLSQEQVKVEDNGIKIIMNGKMEVQEVEGIERGEDIKNLFNKAIREIQIKVAKQISF